ncbi:ZCW7 isoform 1 [Hibiscus syriacus]|uniref:ZCW7 isoform 1 n=1 Tax=Hibiscus syriacus TaxID=106335 RepID=A0A6A3BEA7_HIBSY|nr:ZCW7 isoform 1 [Hibiscus syriacus]
MFQPFICGAFDPEDEGDRRKLRRNSFRKSKGRKKDDKNPYSDRGLDKFSALLAELEQKKQKIYSQTGSQDVSLVRFTYKNSTDFVPIVIKLKDDKEETKKKGADSNINTTKDHQPVMKAIDSDVIDKHPITEGKRVIKKISSRSQSFSDQKKTGKENKRTREFYEVRQCAYVLGA